MLWDSVAQVQEDPGQPCLTQALYRLYSCPINRMPPVVFALMLPLDSCGPCPHAPGVRLGGRMKIGASQCARTRAAHLTKSHTKSSHKTQVYSQEVPLGKAKEIVGLRAVFGEVGICDLLLVFVSFRLYSLCIVFCDLCIDGTHVFGEVGNS